ncbi:flagellar basal body-associated FliL family protein [Maricaulis sp. CAU 1757]
MISKMISAGLLALALTSGASFAAPPAAEDGAHSGNDTRHRTLTASPTYVPLPPLTATVQANHHARGLLQIEAGLEIDDARLRRRVQRYMPRLRNAYVSALSVYTGVNYQYGDVPDADRIAALLQEATDMALGEPGAEILIGMIIIHGS